MASEPFAVVELFTSQGCSSCPPADRLLAELADQGNIFALSFHVDYWDYLGWKDPYSNKKFSERQRKYSKILNSSVYTPQMVINGNSQGVGSRENKIRPLLQKALKQRAKASIKLEAYPAKDNQVAFDYESHTQAKGNYVINLALVERNVSTSVKRGENRGRVLEHDNAVRHFFTTEKLTSTETFPIPTDSNPKELAIIAYLQNASDGTIIGASKVEL